MRHLLSSLNWGGNAGSTIWPLRLSLASRRIAERDSRDGRDEVGIQSAHVAPVAHRARRGHTQRPLRALFGEGPTGTISL